MVLCIDWWVNKNNYINFRISLMQQNVDRQFRRSEYTEYWIHCILNKRINATCKVLVSCFISWTKISLKCSIRTKILFLSNVGAHFSFAKIIHPPDRCGISRSWLNSVIITQVHVGLGTIKGHSKMCSFVTQHNATDVLSFEGVCNWHADCRNFNQSCCQRIECLFLYHKPPPTSF